MLLIVQVVCIFWWTLELRSALFQLQISDHTHHRNNFTLQAANNTIATYGNRLLTLNIGLRCAFQWVFIIADVKNPIIRADFLHPYSILVDIAHNCLVDSLTQLQVQGIAIQE